MSPPVWWTQADHSELDTLAYELVRFAWAHRQGCDVCLAGGDCQTYLDGTAKALDAILDWKQARGLRSRAEWLRAREAVAA
jgi:alkylhydroperoxidase family enzyme